MTSRPRTRKTRLAVIPTTDTTQPEAPQPVVAGEYREIPLSKLVVNPRNGRKTLRDIDGFAATIREVGVLEPLTVRPYDGDTFQICFGHRRFAAATLAGLSVVPCLIKNLDDVQLLKEGLIENLHHDDLTYLEEAEQLAELMHRQALTVQQLADDLGQSPTRVKQRLSLLTLPDKARNALDNAAITYSTALTLTEIADYPDVIDDLIHEQDGVDADDLQESVSWVGIERGCVRLREEAAMRGWRLIEGAEPRGLGYVYVAELDHLTTRQQQAHARQSCHAVYLEVALGRPRLTGLCSDPARHRPATPAPAPEPEDAVRRAAPDGDPVHAVPAGQEADTGDDDDAAQVRARAVETRRREREERERHDQERARNRKRVAAARRMFLAGLAEKRTPKRPEVAVYIFGAVIERAGQTTMAWVGKILGLEPVIGRFGTTDWQTPVTAYAADSSDHLLKVVLLVTSQWAEEHVTQYGSGYDAAMVRHIELLGSLGYTPDPYETEQIAYYRESREQAARQAAAEETHDHDDTDTDTDPDQEQQDAASEPETSAVENTGEQSGETDSSATSEENPAADAVNTDS